MLEDLNIRIPYSLILFQHVKLCMDNLHISTAFSFTTILPRDAAQFVTNVSDKAI